MGIINEEHQNEHLLEQLIKKLISQGEHQEELHKLCSGSTPHDSKIGSLLCELLIKYCSFSFENDKKINPFDDPYVGAALITEQGCLLGAHRKVKHNEPHAEASCIYKAINKIENEESNKLIAKIDIAYQNKIWLGKSDQLESFKQYYSKAGKVLRRYTEQSNKGCKLILISTLEPCKDFESQPSCAHIICKLKPDIVLYGSDDTNEKGQGRIVLNAGKVRTLPNLAVKMNIDKNVLFYSSIHYLRILHDTEKNVPSSFNFQKYYIQVDLNPEEIKPELDNNDRLKIKFENVVNIVRKVNSEVRTVHLGDNEISKKISDLVIDPNKIDQNKVLFINQIDLNFITKYFIKYYESTNLYPGMIVSSFSDNDEETKQHIQEFEDKTKVKIYTNVVRKGDERILASNLIRESYLSQEWSRFYIVCKLENGYCSFSGDSHKIVDTLENNVSSQTNRISFYFYYEGFLHLETLLHDFRLKLLQNKNSKFHNTSIELIPIFFCSSCEKYEKKFACQETCSEYDKSVERINRILNEYHIINRCNIRHEKSNLRNSASQLLYHIKYEGLDPVFIHNKTLKFIIDDKDWRQRQCSGKLLCSFVDNTPDFLQQFILHELNDVCTDGLNIKKHWCMLCSLLNALKKINNEIFSKNRKKIFCSLAKLSRGIEEQGNNDPETQELLVDLIWRMIAVVCTRSIEINEVTSVIKDKIVQIIFSNEFLLKELFYYCLQNKTISNELKEFAWKLLSQSPIYDKSTLKNIFLRIIRISSICGDGIEEFCLKKIESIAEDFPEDFLSDVYCEYKRCRSVSKQPFLEIFSSNSIESQKAFATYLFIFTTNVGKFKRGIRNQIESLLKDNMPADKYYNRGELLSWRGDKMNFARLVLSEIQITYIFNFLEMLARDEDETIQWVAIVMAFDKDIRIHYEKLFTPKQCTLRVVKIIEIILSSKPFYWLQRELLQQMYNEYDRSENKDFPSNLLINIYDSELLKNYIHDLGARPLHIEVAERKELLFSKFNRIALIHINDIKEIHDPDNIINQWENYSHKQGYYFDIFQLNEVDIDKFKSFFNKFIIFICLDHKNIYNSLQNISSKFNDKSNIYLTGPVVDDSERWKAFGKPISYGNIEQLMKILL